MSSKFKKKKENFVCDNCGKETFGDGFTNHCPVCLFSKHVDIFPGDRAENCDGLMTPIATEESGGEWSIIHKCQKCGTERKNKVAKEDDFEKVIKISTNNLGLD